jgi:competence protein ComEC
MTTGDWDKYLRTGVIHVLAISGQHLVVLGGFLWFALRLFGIRRRRGAIFVALFLLAYALLTGGKPPVMRSAVMVCASCLGILLRRPAMAANSFALAWIVVILINPTDIFSAGCQLSFLAVAILNWASAIWVPKPLEPLEQLIEDSRPRWQRGLLKVWRWVKEMYLITIIIWLGAMPLVAYRYHLVSPVGILLGPPLVFLTSAALLMGFAIILLAPIAWPLAKLFGWLTGLCLWLAIGWCIGATGCRAAIGMWRTAPNGGCGAFMESCLPSCGSNRFE